MFSELEELILNNDGCYEWKETARWVRFEEDVEEGSNRWSKPHVSSLSLHSLMELRNLILKGTVFLDLEAVNLNQILDVLLENVIHNGILTFNTRKGINVNVPCLYCIEFSICLGVGCKRSHPEETQTSV